MRVVAAFLLAGLSLPAIAARPLATEDASVLEGKRCQLESWIDRSRVETQTWFVPACNFGANVEWQAGFARGHAEGASRFAEAYAQAKSAWGSLEGDGFAFGAVAGVIRRPMAETARGWENPYLIALFSRKLGSTFVHVNAGWSRDRDERKDSATWGVALESSVSGAITLLGEAYGADREKPFLRAGIRYTAIAGLLDLDASIVSRPGGDRSDRLISIGFLVQTGRFLP